MQQDVQKCRYPGQPEEEVTQRVFYKTFMAVMPIVLAGVLLILVSLFGMSYGAAHPTIQLDAAFPVINGAMLSFVSFLFLVLVCLFLFGAIWIWRNNRILVTNEHVVDIDQNTLFHRTVSTLTLSRIQDVRAEVDGPAQTLLQYGTVVVQTAGERENFSFDYVQNPYEAEQYIIKAHNDYLSQHGEGDGTAAAIKESSRNPLEDDE